ncbi:MAG TPA: prolipoprotein diacylglyceryl transferase family protein [Gemmatimonadaceae bacterium]
MPITHHPFNIEIGPVELTGFGIAVLAGFVIAQIIGTNELMRRGHKTAAEAMPDFVLAAVVGTLIGGKGYYAFLVAGDWRELFSRAGFVFFGGFIGAVAFCWIVAHRKRLPFLRFADMGAICIAAGYSVGRTGCWAVGDDYGRPWDGPLAVRFPEGVPPSTAAWMNQTFGTPIPEGVSPGTVLSVHPTQLYETTLAFFMFLLLWRFRNHRHAEGWLFGMYLVLAGAERFFIEFFRAKDDRGFMGLTLAQGIAVALVIAGIVVMQRLRTVGPGKPGILAAA